MDRKLEILFISYKRKKNLFGKISNLHSYCNLLLFMLSPAPFPNRFLSLKLCEIDGQFQDGSEDDVKI